MGNDSLELLEEVFGLPLLTREDEHRLFMIIANSKSATAVAEAREKLILSNCRLVRAVANKVYPNIPLADKIQMGMLGLVTAIDRFDVNRGTKLSTYARPWIFQAINRNCLDQTLVCGFRLPGHVHENFNKLLKAYQCGEVQLTKESIQLFLQQFGKRVRSSTIVDLIKLLKNEGRVLSLDAEISSERGSDSFTLKNSLVDLSVRVDIEVIGNEVEFGEMMKGLSEVQYRVFELYYLFEMPVAEITEQIGVSKERVRQHIQAGLKKLKNGSLLEDFN